MYAITAVTGHVGGATARELLAAGAPVRVVVRDPAAGTAWSERGLLQPRGDRRLLCTTALDDTIGRVVGARSAAPRPTV